MTISYENRVAIGELSFCIPTFCIGVYLTIKHPSHSSGWIDIAFFSFIRIVGSAMQIRTINNPTNDDLYTGSSILVSVSVVPLVSCAWGLLERLNENIIRRRHKTHLSEDLFRVIQAINGCGFVLCLLGGIDSGNAYSYGDGYEVQVMTKAGTGMIIGASAFVVFVDFYLSFHVSHAKLGMKRLFLGVSLALPLLVARVLYSALTTYRTDEAFHLIGGNTGYWLCLAVIEEALFILIMCTIGFLVNTSPKNRNEVLQLQPNRPEGA